MKKILSLAICFMLIVCMFASCGGAKPVDTTDAQTTTEPTPVVDDTVAETIETTTEPQETEPASLSDTTVTLKDVVTINIKDGWYSEDFADDYVKLEKDGLPFLANVKVEVGTIYSDGQGAQYWADAINGNYGGGGKITTETINGISFYHLSGVVTDDDQNIYFADINDEYYLEVSIMMMPLSDGVGILDCITIG